MAEISIVKMTSGEEVVGTVTYQPEFLRIDDALVFVQRPARGEMGIQLARYMPYAEETWVKLDRLSVVCVAKASDAISEFYKISVVYNAIFTKKIDASINEAAIYMKTVLDSEEPKEDLFKTMGSDILNNFSSNTKN
jgi:hypothetical protein